MASCESLFCVNFIHSVYDNSLKSLKFTTIEVSLFVWISNQEMVCVAAPRPRLVICMCRLFIGSVENYRMLQ